jgi:hypothetical protein
MQTHNEAAAIRMQPDNDAYAFSSARSGCKEVSTLRVSGSERRENWL